MKFTYSKESFLTVVALSVLAGCVSPATRASNQAMDNSFAQQMYADNTPLQSWQDMRHESEIKEVFEEDWSDKLQRMEKASAARSRKGTKAATEQSPKPGKAAAKPAPAKTRQDGNSQDSRK